jgi:hypothetical protein
MHEDDMNDDERYGWRYPSREQRARQAKRDANKKDGDRYYASNFKWINLRKEWKREWKIKRHFAYQHAMVREVFGIELSTGLLFPPPPHAPDAKLPPPHAPNAKIIVILDSDDDKDDQEVVFDGTRRAAVIDDSPVVSYLPD